MHRLAQTNWTGHCLQTVRWQQTVRWPLMLRWRQTLHWPLMLRWQQTLR
jgi:hypothetical protein